MPSPFSRIEIKMSTNEEITKQEHNFANIRQQFANIFVFFYIVILYFYYLYYFSNIFALVMADDVENIKNIPNYIGIKLVD